MKKAAVFFSVMVCGLLLSFPLEAQIDNLSNMSAEWIRTSNRNAATDAADIVVYNPAGLVKLSDGFHLNVSNQSLFRKPEHHFTFLGSATYQQDSPDWFLPNLYLAYKRGNWAIFGGVYIPGGGAVADYPGGSITTHLIAAVPLFTPPELGGVLGIYDGFKDGYLEASSLYLTFTLGGAYAINDHISVAVGGRYITAKNKYKTGLTFFNSQLPIPELGLGLNAEETAEGFGAILGLNISPSNKLNIGIRYETKVKLEFETEVKVDDFGGILIEDGVMNRRDFPAMFGIGAAYRFSPAWTLEADFNYYFQKQANWGSVLLPTGIEDYSELAGDCYAVGAALIFQVNPKLALSGGLIYTKFLFNDMDGYYTNLGAVEVQYYDNLNVSAGFAYEILPNVKLNLGISYGDWDDPQVIQALAALPFVVPVELMYKGYALAVGLDIAI
jgi:long-chain fatty acid transport protein